MASLKGESARKSETSTVTTPAGRGPWWQGLTGYQWLVLTVAFLGWVFDIMDTALFNFAKVSMLKEMLGGEAAYKLHGPLIEGQIQTVFLIGWAIGGFVFGILADRWGRTRTLIATILLYCLLTGLTGLCQTPGQVMVARFLTALGIGGEWAAGAALVAEVFPTRARASAAAVLQSAAAFGPALAGLANLWLADVSWRWLFLVGVAPAALCVVIRTKVREPERTRPAVSSMGFLQPLRDLLSEPVWRRNAIVATIIGVVGVTGAGMIPFWLPNLVNAANLGMPEEVIRARTTYTTWLGHLGTLLGVLAFPWLAERIGRRSAFAVFFVLSPISVGLALYGGADYGRLLLLLPLAFFFTIGLSAGFVLYFPELFATRFRATGAGMAYNMGRIFSAPAPWITGAVIAGFGGNVALGVLSIVAVIYVIGLLALPLAPETRGKPLPE